MYIPCVIFSSLSTWLLSCGPLWRSSSYKPCRPIASNGVVHDGGASLGGLPARRPRRLQPLAEAAGVPGRGVHVGPLMTRTGPLLHHRLPRHRRVPGAGRPHPPAELAGHWICNSERLDDCVTHTRIYNFEQRTAFWFKFLNLPLSGRSVEWTLIPPPTMQI
jgi:hypothetical protein